MQDDSTKSKKLSLWQIVKSTAAAAIGVQSQKNLDEDFAHGKPIHYIVTGIIFVAVFIASIVGLVTFLLNKSA